mmetsp:Transcript_32621/g.93671  ORF Transcript_32621/g.93671 Transcript_32621/m.93671 type:complete len:245 (+) Transcript_32621:1267-2001(+)
MVLQEVHLRALLEIRRLTLGQQIEAQVIVDAQAGPAGRRPNVQVLVVAMRHNDLVAGGLVDLGRSYRIVRVRLERTEKLACEVAFHGIGVVVHEHGIFRLQQWLHLEETRNGGVTRPSRNFRVIWEEALCHREVHVPTTTDRRVCVEDVHLLREEFAEVHEQLLRLSASVLHGNDQAHGLHQLLIRACRVGGLHRIRDARKGGVAEKPRHARRVQDAPNNERHRDGDDRGGRRLGAGTHGSKAS